MCGIVGYIGQEQAAPILLDGLKRLEYRGYDSAGVAVYNRETGTLSVRKAKGRLHVLAEQIHDGADLRGTVGVGHTRWATHGAPSDVNSHPQVSRSGRIAVVHNGIIENYAELKSFLMDQGVPFTSETDTEVVAQLIEYFCEQDQVDILEAVGRCLRRTGTETVLAVPFSVKKPLPLLPAFCLMRVVCLAGRLWAVLRLDREGWPAPPPEEGELLRPSPPSGADSPPGRPPEPAPAPPACPGRRDNPGSPGSGGRGARTGSCAGRGGG